MALHRLLEMEIGVPDPAGLDAFYRDTAEAYRRAVRAFYEAGCRYLQLDDTVWAYLCSAAERQAARARAGMAVANG